MELNFIRMKEIRISVVYVKLYKKMQQHVSNQPGISFYHQLTQDPLSISDKSSTLCVHFIKENNHHIFKEAS